MAEWQRKIPACFGNADGIFAGHTNERERVLKLLIELERKTIEWEGVRSEFRKFMQDKKWRSQHIKEQEAKIEKLMKPWFE